VVPARADVTLREETVSSGLAGSGIGTSGRTTVIAGDLSRTERGFAGKPGMDPQPGSEGTGPASTRRKRAQDQVKKDEQEDAAAADNAGDAIAHGDVGGALGGMPGHRLGKAFP